MADKDTLRKQAAELAGEVSAKMADVKAGKITQAEFATFMDHAEAQNAEIETGIKNYERALAFRAAPEDSGEPQEQQEDLRGKAVQDAYHRAQKAASSHTRESVSFELGFKAQGVTGLMGEGASGTSAPSALSGYFLGGSAGPAVEPQFIPGIVDLRFYPNVIASLFPNMPVSSPVVSYVKESSWTNNAAAVNEGATKPTSTNAVTRLTEQLGKIANLARVTDELIQDAPYFWALIQQRLAQGVVRQEEVQLLAGEGYPGVNGLLNRTTGFTKPQTITAVTNLQVPAASTPGMGTSNNTVDSVTPGREVVGSGAGVGPTGVAIAEGILAALTDIRVRQFFEPDAIVLNPTDWQTVRLAKDTAGQYLGGSFFGTNYGQGASVPTANVVDQGLTLWGKRVVATPALPAGYILVGAFAQAGQVLRKGGLQVDMTNTNGTDFEQNLWTVRAEERVGLLVDRPELFELIKLTNGS